MHAIDRIDNTDAGLSRYPLMTSWSDELEPRAENSIELDIELDCILH